MVIKQKLKLPVGLLYRAIQTKQAEN